MASTDATTFPVKGQAYRIPVSFRDTTGVLITGWTGAVSSISIDGAATASGNTPTEIGTSGMGYLDISSSSMNGNLIHVKCTVTNTNATAYVAGLYPLDMTEPTGRFDAQSVVKWEQILTQLFGILCNKYAMAIGGTETIYKKDDSTTMLSNTFTATATATTRTKRS